MSIGLKGPRARVQDLRQRYKLTAQDIADATASDIRSVRRWSSQEQGRRSRVDEHIQFLERVITMLEETGLLDDSIRVWLREPNRYLHYRTPLAEIGARHFDAVMDSVRAIREGAFGVGIPGAGSSSGSE